MKTDYLRLKYIGIVFASLACTFSELNAQDKLATLSMDFAERDSVKVCNVHVLSGDTSVKELNVKLFVQGMFSLLEVGKPAATNDEGVASFDLPDDLPADKNGKLVLVAKIEDDENFANTEAKATIAWNIKRVSGDVSFSQRSLWGSAKKAPLYLVLFSTLSVITVLGFMIYVLLLVRKIKKEGKHFNKVIIHST